ncbi:MAG TPA: hypothetical protein VFS00_10075 [Polyangiaceae bacterium]|nr:hypothetical protein [Polyangiaceae bacterium]
MRPSYLVLGLSAGSLWLSACGGSAMPASAPEAPSSMASGDESFATVDDAERGLKRAEAELRMALGPASGAAEAAGSDKAGPPPQPAAPPPAPPPASPPAGGATTPATREGLPAEAPSCATACRALGSMTKATETICRLAGAGDERCSKAQHSLDEARSSMRTCVCVTAR